MTVDTQKLRELLANRQSGWPFPSDQALVEQIPALLAEIDALRALVAEMAENDTYETEYDGRMYSICHGCGAQDGEDHRRADCVYLRAQAALNPPAPPQGE